MERAYIEIKLKKVKSGLIKYLQNFVDNAKKYMNETDLEVCGVKEVENILKELGSDDNSVFGKEYKLYKNDRFGYASKCKWFIGDWNCKKPIEPPFKANEDGYQTCFLAGQFPASCYEPRKASQEEPQYTQEDYLAGNVPAVEDVSDYNFPTPSLDALLHTIPDEWKAPPWFNEWKKQHDNKLIEQFLADLERLKGLLKEIPEFLFDCIEKWRGKIQ